MTGPYFYITLVVLAGALCVTGQSGNREDAFIGYSERALECKDRLDDCHGKAKHDGCLKDPYNMRTFCPVSCVVSKCMSTGSLKVRHRGFALPAGTATYAQRWAAGYLGRRGDSEVFSAESRHFRTRDFQGAKLKLSSLGVGTYLGDMDDRTDDAVAAALIHSVMNGWNVIDTASNYRWGRAETSVGAALDSLLAGAAVSDFLADNEYTADVTRDMLFISTKAGFTDEALVRQLVKDKVLNRKDVSGGHSLAPAYLNASVAASLERMNLETVDLLYLHNPAEMLLRTLGMTGFKTKLTEAFRALEVLRAAGSLRSYGLATWDCFRVPPTDPGHVSLEDMVGLAREAAGTNPSGFAAIQLPVSAGMPEAWSQPWQTVGNATMTLMEAAKALGIAVFTSGPMGEGDLLKRLTSQLDGVVELRSQATTAQKLIQIARSTPGDAMVTTLVGHKTREFVVANTQLSKDEPLTEVDFRSAMQSVRAIMAEGATVAGSSSS